MTTMDIFDNFLERQLLFDCYCIAFAKAFCRIHKSIAMSKVIFQDYCNAHESTKIFRMKYLDGLTAEIIAEKENIDRRTVFKLIDKEMCNFGLWLYKKVYIPSVLYNNKFLQEQKLSPTKKAPDTN